MSSGRHETRIENETYYIESNGDWIEVGPVPTIVELFGGKTYTLKYTETQSSAAWLDTADDDTITIDIRETLESMSYRDNFVTNLENCPLNETGIAGYPKRTELYVDLMTEVFESKGNLEG